MMKIGQDPLQPHCKVCGANLTPLQATREGLCDRLECRGPFLQQQQRAAREKRRRERLEQAEVGLRLVEHTLLQDEVTAVVPYTSSVEVPTPPERLQEFRNSLKRVIASAEPDRSLPDEQAVAETGKPESLRDPELEAGQASLYVVNGCATCRGACCKHGQTHAFIDRDCILSYWKRNVELDADQVFARYVEHLPTHSISGSCVFHTEHGCALPRPMRGSTCNGFLCEGLRDHSSQISQFTATACLAVATNERGVVEQIGRVAQNGQPEICYRRPMESPRE